MSIGSGYSYSYIFKYIIVGDMGVGKSCLMQQFIDKKFVPDCPHTIGVEFAAKVIELDGQKIKLQIWDTAGQERFRAVTRSYYRGAACVILVFDITRKSTFNRINLWAGEAKNLACDNAVFFLIGNKADLEDQRDVTFEAASEMAEEHDLTFLECSAKSGKNVEEAFSEAARRIYQKIRDGGINLNNADTGFSSNKGIMGTGGGSRNIVDLSGGQTSASLSSETGRQGCSC